MRQWISDGLDGPRESGVVRWRNSWGMSCFHLGLEVRHASRGPSGLGKGLMCDEIVSTLYSFRILIVLSYPCHD